MTTPAIPPTRADELKPGDVVAVSATRTMTVEAVRPGQPGDTDIRWRGVDLWATVPSDREFTVVEEAPA